MVGIAILVFVFVGATNFILDEYAKGVVRTAVDEAAQSGATAGGSLPACEAEAEQVKADLLPGPFGSDLRISCGIEGDEMVASATGSLPTFVPAVPGAEVSVVGFSLIEKPPAP
jgi:hypothetical protein